VRSGVHMRGMSTRPASHVRVDFLQHEIQVIAEREFQKALVHADAVGAVGRGAMQNEAQLHAAGDVSPGIHEQRVAREFVRHTVKLDFRPHFFGRAAAFGRTNNAS